MSKLYETFRKYDKTHRNYCTKVQRKYTEYSKRYGHFKKIFFHYNALMTAKKFLRNFILYSIQQLTQNKQVDCPKHWKRCQRLYFYNQIFFFQIHETLKDYFFAIINAFAVKKYIYLLHISIFTKHICLFCFYLSYNYFHAFFSFSSEIYV